MFTNLEHIFPGDGIGLCVSQGKCLFSGIYSGLFLMII